MTLLEFLLLPIAILSWLVLAVVVAVLGMAITGGR